MSLFSEHLVSRGVPPLEAGLTDLARYHLEEVHRHAGTCRKPSCPQTWIDPTVTIIQGSDCYVSPASGAAIHACGWCGEHPGVCMCPCGSVNRGA